MDALVVLSCDQFELRVQHITDKTSETSFLYIVTFPPRRHGFAGAKIQTFLESAKEKKEKSNKTGEYYFYRDFKALVLTASKKNTSNNRYVLNKIMDKDIIHVVQPSVV